MHRKCQQEHQFIDKLAQYDQPSQYNIIALRKQLQQNGEFRNINLYMKIPIQAMKLFITANFANLQTLACYRCDLRDMHMKKIVKIYMPNLLMLNLQANLINDEGIKYLSNYSHFPKIRQIYLSENIITDLGAIHLMKSNWWNNPFGQNISSLTIYEHRISQKMMTILRKSKNQRTAMYTYDYNSCNNR